MRALVVHPGPHFSVADVYQGWVEGLKECGVEVATLNLDDRLDFYQQAHVKRGDRFEKAFGDTGSAVRMAGLGLKAAAYDWWPDFILVISAFFVPPDFYPVFKDRGHKVVVVHTESPYEDDRQVEIATFADLNVLNDPTNLEHFNRVAPSIYIPHGYDPQRHKPGPALDCYASDFCFVGTGFQSRIAFFEQVDWSGIRPVFAGNWQATTEDSPLRDFLPHPVEECCPNEETVKLYNSTKVSANLYRKEASETADGWAMGPREVELAATGTFFLREPRPEGDELFPMLPTFSEPGEFEELLRYFLSHDRQREEAAQKAREVVSDRTFSRHAALMLQELDKQGGN